MYFNDDYNNSEFSDHRIIELYCCSLNELFSREKTRSAAADEGCSSRIDLQATADEACMCYQPITGNCSAMGWQLLCYGLSPVAQFTTSDYSIGP